MDVDIATRGSARAAHAAKWLRARPWLCAGLAGLGLVAIFLLTFEWNWLRHPLERYISNKTQREFRVGHLDIDFGLVPTIKLKDVYFANAHWSKNTEPTATIGTLEFSVSLRDVWETKKIYIPRATLSDANLQLERAADLKKNWVLREPERSAEPSRVRIGSISMGTGSLRYVNHANPFTVDIVASPARIVTAAASSARLTTHLAFNGVFRNTPFRGDAMTGEVISLRDTRIAFPIKGSLSSTTNKLEAEGSLTDVADLLAADLNVRVAGRSLHTLHATLNLPLPESPPYEFRGHVRKTARGYAVDELAGLVGASDVRGKGDYNTEGARPRLTAMLESKTLNVADLLGKKTTSNAHKATPLASQGTRLGDLDAEIHLAAAKVQLSREVLVEDMKLRLSLKEAVAKLAPLDMAFAGGRIVSEVVVDARNEGMVGSSVSADFRRLQLAKLLSAKLFTGKAGQAKPVGAVGAQVRLKGTGTSLSDLAASTNGTIAVAMEGGRISNAMDAAVGMNGGKLLSSMVGGDRGVNVNCAALHIDVKNGVGQSRLLVVDTEQTRLDGVGGFNLKDERFAFTLEPKPKKPGILSMRTPVYLHGTFSEPHMSFEKSHMAMRAGSAVALALINPIAALLPLVEKGSDAVTDCEKLLTSVAGARQQTAAHGSAPRNKTSDDAPRGQ